MTSNPEFSGNLKYPGKIQGVVMSWKKCPESDGRELDRLWGIRPASQMELG